MSDESPALTDEDLGNWITSTEEPLGAIEAVRRSYIFGSCCNIKRQAQFIIFDLCVGSVCSNQPESCCFSLATISTRPPLRFGFKANGF